MIPTEKEKCILEQWLYGLKVHGMGCFNPKTEEIYVMEIVDMDITNNHPRAIIIPHDDNCDEDSSYLSIEDEIFPILHPLSNLTKEITHKGYNDDKPFIPIIEIAKEQYGHLGSYNYKPTMVKNINIVECCDENNRKKIISITETQGIFVLCVAHNPNEEPSEEIIPLQPIFDLLHLWHFDTRNLIETNKAIDINTLNVNPYQIQQ